MQEFSPYLVGGATRPDAISGLNPEFAGALWQLIQEAPPDIQAELRLTSGYRSPEIQAQLWKDAVAKYGSEAAARKWVAPPGKSNHNHGGAVDFKYLGDKAKAYVHQVADKYGLHFPMEWEPWHVEYKGGTNALAGATEQPSPYGQPNSPYQQPENMLEPPRMRNALAEQPRTLAEFSQFLRRNRLGA